jgi:hypothetical protein
LAELARDKYKADYIISNDADEFWSPKTGSLKDHLQQSVVKVPRTNMLPLRRDIEPTCCRSGETFFNQTSASINQI